jgi:hypothetical protein
VKLYIPDAISKDADEQKSVQKYAKDLLQAWGLHRSWITIIMMIIKIVIKMIAMKMMRC